LKVNYEKTFIICLTLTLVITSIIIYWNLPIEITRKSDIEAGNKIIKNIEAYQKANGKFLK
jgi:hypothetical protein